MASFLAELDPDVTWQDPDFDLDDALHHGRAAIEQHFRFLLARYEHFEVWAEAAELQDDAVVVDVRADYRYRREATARSEEVFGPDPQADVVSYHPEHGFTYPRGDFEASWWQSWRIEDGTVRYVREAATREALSP